MVHKRSSQARIRRLLEFQTKQARKAARLHGYKDKLLNEKVVTQQTKIKIIEHLILETLKHTNGKLGYINPEIVTLHEPGDVLEDSLGRGTLQQPTEDLTRQKTQHQFKHTQQADGLT